MTTCAFFNMSSKAISVTVIVEIEVLFNSSCQATGPKQSLTICIVSDMACEGKHYGT